VAETGLESTTCVMVDLITLRLAAACSAEFRATGSRKLIGRQTVQISHQLSNILSEVYVDLLLLSKQFSGQGTFHQQLDLNLRNKLVKCYIWSIVLCDDEN
jgi:hypothetical protein